MKEKEKQSEMSQDVIIDRSVKLNPNNELFWKARGYQEKPENWQQILVEMEKPKK